MPKIPENKPLSLWLFADNVKPNHEYKFLGFEPEYKTASGKKLPVFILFGTVSDKKGNNKQAEVLTTAWNIQNIEDVKKQLGENTDDWKENLFFKILVDESSERFIFIPVEVVK